jgi:PadR family transcriptional regulator
VQSSLAEATATRGGKRKRVYAVTSAGRQALEDLRRVRERIGQVIEGRRS